jgi:hypothetical protein
MNCGFEQFSTSGTTTLTGGCGKMKTIDKQKFKTRIEKLVFQTLICALG